MNKKSYVRILGLLLATSLFQATSGFAGSYLDTDGDDPTFPGCLYNYAGDNCTTRISIQGESCSGNTLTEYKTGTGPGDCFGTLQTITYDCNSFCTGAGHASGVCTVSSNFCGAGIDSSKCICYDGTGGGGGN